MKPKKILSVIAVTSLLLSSLLAFVPTYTAFAQAPFTTAFAVQNLGNQDATVVVQWYTKEGDLVYTSPAQIIHPGELGNYLAGDFLGTSWSGSVVISSDQPIAAIANTTDNFATPGYWGSAEGFGAGSLSTSSYLPFALRNRGGRTSTIGVQNAGSAQADIYINFIGHESSPVNTRVVKNLKPGASTILNLNSDVTALGDNWMGSVVITSTQNVAATALDVGTNILYNYSGVAQPSTDLLMPFVVGARSNQDTASALLNPNPITATVTMTFTGQIGTSTVVVSTTREVGPGQMWNLLHSSVTGAGFLGSGIVHSNVPVLGIVNHTYGSFGAPGRKQSYTMINASAATPNISLPYILRARGNKVQGVIIQNTSAVTTTLYVSFKPLPGAGNGNPYTYQREVGPGMFYNFGTSFSEWAPIGDGAYGTMVITNTAGVNIVAIVNTWNPYVSANVDSLGSYIGINY